MQEQMDNGGGVKKLIRRAAGPVVFIGAVCMALPGCFCRRQRYGREFRNYFSMCGSGSLLIVVLISLLMGMVLGIQGILQMSKFGAEIFMADLIGFAVLKELGPMMVALTAAGRAGSAFAAEIGSMKANEELDALRTFGVEPAGFLVLPKLAAMLLALPLLTIFGDAAGLLGGMSVGVVVGGIPAAAYWERTVAVLDVGTLLLGLSKTIFFALVITLTGCYCGFSTGGDARGVGEGATRAVVTSIFLLVICDALLTVLFSFIGY